MCTTLSIVKVFGIDHSCEVLNVILKIKSGLLLITTSGDLWSVSISRCSSNITQAGDFQLKYHPPTQKNAERIITTVISRS